ncbi:DUF3987 domain-containing protein [Williamsia sp. 1135]|uniref:DUF3987 domain-containing protein n=1 Tax=Williamsia sp. 1135 TaxID=1889262 RepID=UPI00117EC555|nr:DUF3987 domain-containing protein [Williamsia sp. 1135]
MTADVPTTEEVLDHLAVYARARRVAPAAVVAEALLRAVAAVEPTVRLPALIGGQVSLNLFAALVGRSGEGKGSASACAAEALEFVDFNGLPIITESFPVGSGEGVARTYQLPGANPDDPWDRSRAIFTAPEVDSLTALSGRQGSTLLPELRKVYTGESIGFANGGKATRLVLPAHSYRACVSVGVQPERAGTLLRDADGGTPQRFVWASVVDSDAPEERPKCPKPLAVRLARWGSNVTELSVPDEARVAIDAQRLAVLRGDPEVNPLDGHAMLTRLKIAAALMILGGRTVVDADDWALAGRVMLRSQRTRERVERVLGERRQKMNRAKAHETADHNEVVADSRLQRAASAITRKLEREREPMQPSDLRRALRSDLRGEFGAAVDLLTEQGQIVRVGNCFSLASTVTGHGGSGAEREGVDTSTPGSTPNTAGQPGWTGVDGVDTTNTTQEETNDTTVQ